jgi:uncharacterized protein
MDDLVEQNGITYKKFTEGPFTGQVDEGREQGSFQNGLREGVWVSYRTSGLLKEKGNFKNGKIDGPWMSYHENGQLRNKGDFKNDEKEGSWVNYYENGQISEEAFYKNGKNAGSWAVYYENGQLRNNGELHEMVDGAFTTQGLYVSYYENGQLEQKGDIKNGKKEGSWVGFLADGSVDEKLAGTFKDGVKISD